MKRVFSMAIVVVLTLAVLCLVACGQEAHVHTYAEKVVQATCVNPGYTEYTPTCGCEGLSVYRDHLVSPSGKHNYVELSKEPSTCDKQGHVVYGCKSCGQTYVETLALKEHNYAAIDTTEFDPCVDTENVPETCLDCGYVRYVTVKATHGDNIEVSIKNPTCNEIGKKYTFCSVCSAHLDEEDIPALGCNFVLVVVVDPTCEKEGKGYYECERCGAFSQDTVIDALKHDLVEHVKNPTCEEDGIKYYQCNACGHVEGEEEIPHGHSYSEWLAYDIEGFEYRKCSVCGEIEYREASK